MSLGTTIAPAGETGLVESVRPMPNQIPDNPGTMVATTSVEDIMNVMYRNWIWRNTFTIDTSMLSGQVFGTIKIHPKNCNDYITHVSAMFKTWVGSMKIRTRFMATFQFGGSFRLGWLPPVYTQTQIQQLPIQTLTAYPNIDLDPKNTGWNDFQSAEERNVLFHWMEGLESEDPQSFGGWYVFYVAAPLVVSGGTNTQISLLVESAGSFNFAQLAPITALGPSANAWIDSDILSSQVGREDLASISHLQIVPGTVKSINTGWWHMLGLSGIKSTENLACTLSTRVRNYLENKVFGLQPEAVGPGSYAQIAEDSYPYITRTPTTAICTSMENGRAIITDASLGMGGSDYHFGVGAADQPPSWNGDILLRSNDAKTGVVQGPYACSWAMCTRDNQNGPIDTSQLGIFVTGRVMDESVLTNGLNESIVMFVNTLTRTTNTQTTAQASSLTKALPTFDRSISQIYQVVNTDTNVAVLTVRLTPYGYFTTNSVATTALLPASKLYFRYLQDLPMSSPLPPAMAEERSFIRAARRYTMAGQPDKIAEYY